MSEAALIRQLQRVAMDVGTVLTWGGEEMARSPAEYQAALKRLVKFAATGDADADAALQQAAAPGRLARIAESERCESWCIAHHRLVRWQPGPIWWYHHPARIPELDQCTALLAAKAPPGRAA